MSDESKDSPPAKLKLSRDLKTRNEPGETDADKAPPSMKLRRKETDEASPPQSPGHSPTEPPPTPTPERPAEPPSPPAGGDRVSKTGFDPKNPFGNAIKQREIKTPSGPPPELPSKPAPKVEDGSGAKVEAAIHSMNPEPDPDEAAAKNTLFTSLLVLLLLLLVLAGAGYGLWKVLQTPSEAEAAPASATGNADSVSPAPTPAPSVQTEIPETAETPTKGPIQKAKDAVARVPVADVEAITGVEAPAAPPVATPPASAENSFDPVPAATSSAVEASKQNVAQYLSGIHIGGVRKGERPMILIGGESFQVGEVVHPETGLQFDGLRDGRLAFRDRYGIVYLKSF